MKPKGFYLEKSQSQTAKKFYFYDRIKRLIDSFERAENKRTKNISDAVKFIKSTNEQLETGKAIAWGITLKGDSKIIGSICLWNFSENNTIAEVGYDLNPEFQGKGIMSESLRGVIDFGFKEIKLNKIEAFTHRENIRSKNLLEKNCFSLNRVRIDVDNDSNIIFECYASGSIMDKK